MKFNCCIWNAEVATTEWFTVDAPASKTVVEIANQIAAERGVPASDVNVRKPRPLRLTWNVDLSISVHCHHDLVAKFKGVDARSGVDSFCAGWFGTEDKTEWAIRWYYRDSKKKEA